MFRRTASLICLCFVLTPVMTLADDAAGPIIPTAKTELFNGKDMTGWVSYLKGNAEASKTWSVKDGLLCCTGKPNGYLRTEKAYANYKLTVEWRFVKPCNTGVLVHMQMPEGTWPKCVECQGMHNVQGDMYFWSGSICKEKDPKKPKVSMKHASAEKAVAEWNTYQVICAADSITILVNGQEMNKATACTPASGFIGIQSEGGPIEVKTVTLEPLDK
jgi:hypothetical protein